MTTGKRLRVLPPRWRRVRSSRSVGLALLLGTLPFAATWAAGREPTDSVAASRGQAQHKTTVTGVLEQGLCFALAMPAEWQVTVRDGATTRLTERASGVELEVTVRSAAELHGASQPDLVRRDAAVLQASYEALIGRPAHAVSLDPQPIRGALRWRATWHDGNMPGSGRSFTAETLIVPLSPRWLVEVTLGNVDNRPVYEAVLKETLSNLDVREGADCGRPAAPALR